jgi:hypothetical protein
MQSDEKALGWQAILKQIRHLDTPEAIVYTMAQGFTQEEATDLVMDFQKNRLQKGIEKTESPKFTDSPFFKEVIERHNGR